ncbi:MAG: MMPL family transporter [Candidatus Pristimantibacillus lignocellulolyticus]|uniref:MMPL family transporter n=1 Tax=Candidatus Pristimantibacillus lignocellulolyticus TaxID=2994561 RepID=A0A9J6ZIP0_9BACL|nr:MAG: MMPL family transporter [Candidatus Pristimantibacillus lignocellulolyticus]
MKKWLNARSISLVSWIVITILVLLMMPNMDQLVREKGQITIPDSAQSEFAAQLMNEMQDKDNPSYDIIAVFNSGTNEALSTAQLTQVESIIGQLKTESSKLGIVEMTTHLDHEAAEKQLASEDGTTILMQIAVSQDSGTITEIADRLNEVVDQEGIETYLTGTGLVLEDFVQSLQEGIQRTEVIAIVFILIVLIIVFRSPIVPLISLLSVGVSYLVSMGIVAQLVDHFNYPFSNFTQVFLVVILFGIGTDYNILLFTRFKEELSRSNNVLEAIKTTYQTAGKTVVYSGLAVFIGFITLIFAEFQVYRSSSAVAIGVAVLILVLLTLNPFFMAIMGKKMFWPVKKFEGHSDSRLWAMLSKFSVMRPIITLVLILALCIPIALSYSRVLSYNDLIEVEDHFRSKQGINVIEEHYSAGFSSPTSLVLKMDRELDNTLDLQAIDELAASLLNVDGVSNIFTVTRPEGEKINELYISDQTSELNSGLNEVSDGVNTINDGFKGVEDQLAGQDTNDLNSIQQLIDGTSTVQAGATQLGNVLEQLSDGIKSGATGADELATGLTTLQGNITELSTGVSRLYDGYSELYSGLNLYGNQFTAIKQAINGTIEGYKQIEQSMNLLIEEQPELVNHASIQTTLAIAASAQTQLSELVTGLDQFSSQHVAAMSALATANESLLAVNGAFGLMNDGVTALIAGSDRLSKGLEEGSQGSAEIAGKSGELASGIGQINDGQREVLAKLTGLVEQMTELQSGLSESTNGLDQISEGLTEAQNYLIGLSGSSAAQKFYIPDDIIASDEFQQSMDMYMSDDRKYVTMNIVLSVNPYSKEAITIVQNVNKQLQASIEGSILQDGEYALGGKSAQNVDLQQISSSDLNRTAVMMLIGIGIVLLFITRSLWSSLIIVASLLITYLVSLGLTELVTTEILKVEAVGWNVPFFGFIMIVALGVDYSIFLMMRYREVQHIEKDAILVAARNIGGVVISAAVILGGTFAALIPSGIYTLIEVAIMVIFGLIILSLIMLPAFMPAIMSLMGKASKRRSSEE